MPESGSLIGQTISHYRILELVSWACGELAVVYKAEDTRLHRAVILRFLQRTDDPAVLDRLRREVQTISALNHPNIVSVYDVGEYERQPFVAMEFLDGETLDDHISGKALPFEEILNLSIQIVDALTAAHAEGIIHREIKPDNLFVAKQANVKVLGFSIEKFLVVGGSGVSSVATVDTLLYTARHWHTYMSPEQVRGEKLDARTDLFSFGAVLYEMATGRKAFPGNTTVDIFDAILNQTTTPLPSVNPDIPPELERIVNKALEKDRKLRYQTAPEISADLQRLNRDRQSATGPRTGKKSSN
jgi:serine/threonine protein kinase